MKISHTEASKLQEANCKTRLSGPTPKARVWAATKLHSPPCSSSTPLGRPVEPEV